jgi:hypothetical protein
MAFSIEASDYPSIQDAIDDAIANDIPEVRLPEGVTDLSSELQIPVLASSRPLILRGRPHRSIDQSVGTTLRADASMRSVLAILSANHRVQDIKIDADRNATYGLYLENTYASHFDNVLAMNAIADGWHFASSSSNNNSVRMSGCWAHANGTTYATSGIASEYNTLFGTTSTISGTAATTAASATITISSGPDLTTLGIRKNDFVRVGGTASTAYFGIISSVTSTTIVVQSQLVPQTTASGLAFAIFVGFGVNLTEGSNNNILVVVGGNYRGSSGSNFNVQGLFGSTFVGCSFEFGHFAGFSVGRADGSTPVEGTLLDNCYFEANQAAEIWANQCTNLTITGPTFGSVNPPYDIRPHLTTFSPAQGVLQLNGLRTVLQSGAEQDFVFELRNNGGTIEHRFISDFLNGGAAAGATRINGQSSSYSTTPSVGSGTGFTAGAGIQGSNRILFDTAEQPNAAEFRPPSAVVEFDSTGNAPRVYATRINDNVNGVTLTRFALGFVTSNGAAFNINTTNIAAGKQILVRVTGGYIK